jgi:phosphoglucosamine mutase
MNLFGTSGIRGIVGKEITPELALNVGMAVGSYVDGDIVVGHDSRTSSHSLHRALIAGILACGRNVWDIGLAPTPTTGIVLKEFGCSAGVTVTASHNPPEYNGIKLWDNNGVAFSQAEPVVERLVSTKEFALQRWEKIGEIRHRRDEALKIHKNKIIQKIHLGRRYKIALDCGNAVGSVLSPYIFKDLDCEVISLNAHPSGYFPRGLEPKRDNLTLLSKTVRSTEADLGIAHDGDADRVGIIDENGEYVDYDVILALTASYVLNEGDTFITTVDASMKIDAYLDSFGIAVQRTRVGDVAVAEEMARTNTAFGGEPSGTWIFRNFQMTPDGIYAGAKVLEMKDQRGDICELRKDVPEYAILREKIPCKNNEKSSKMEKIEEKLLKYDALTDIDGLRVSLEDSWFLIRPSGTEPYIRITCEAKTRKKAEKLLDECKKLV